MSRFAVLALFLFSKTLVSAQPGGGGGLCIGGFYDKQRQKIDLFTDKNIEIRSFGLQNGKLLYESKLFQYQPANYKGKPQTDFCLLKNIEDREPNDRQNDQRLYIKYKGETMVLDLLNIMGENGMGNHDEMDSVVVHSGYFCYDRDVKARYLRQERGGETRKNTKNGLTPNTQAFLIGKNILKVTPKCNTDFLLEKNLPASYFVHEARVFLANKQPKPAFDALEKAISKNKNVKDCAILLLLCEYYTHLGNYNKAIAYITEGLECRIGRYADAETNYRIRINLYIKNGQYSEALADYNTMIDRADEPFYCIMERHDFKMRYLKDYIDAANDMKKLLKAIEKEDTDEHSFDANYMAFSRPFYALAQAEQAAGNRAEAATHFLRAMECGLGRNNSGTEIVMYLDTVLQQSPSPEGYAARGLAHHGRAQYLGWGDATKAAFEQAIADFDRAEQMGVTDYRLNWFRAQSLHQLKKYNAALEQINITIHKNPNVAACYGLRYNIRQELGQARYGDYNDPDILRQTELNKGK